MSVQYVSVFVTLLTDMVDNSLLYIKASQLNCYSITKT